MKISIFFFVGISWSSPSTPRLFLSSARDILPCRTKSTASTGKETLFLIFLSILIILVGVHLRSTDERCDEHNKVNSYSRLAQ